MKIQPAGHYLLVSVHDAEASPTIVSVDPTDPNSFRYPYCHVKAVGPDAKNVKVGDKVICMPANLIGFNKDDNTFLLSAPCILGFLVDEVPSN